MLEHPEAERADPYEKDAERVWRDSGKVYGARKIKHALGHEGVTLSRRRINRIMKRNGMAVCVQLVVAGLVTMIFRV